MKYKVGDLVKVKSDLKGDDYYGNLYFSKEMENYIGKTYRIEICCYEHDNYYLDITKAWKFNDAMLELAEEKNRFKIGQRVKIKRTGKNAKIHDITDNDYLDNGASFRCYKVYYEKENNIDWGMFSVHDLEEVEEILTEKEKEYLRAVIKPFRKRIDYIEKIESWEHNHIRIDLDDDRMSLPTFEKGEMYKGMEIEKKYTLEELGL